MKYTQEQMLNALLELSNATRDLLMALPLRVFYAPTLKPLHRAIFAALPILRDSGSIPATGVSDADLVEGRAGLGLDELDPPTNGPVE